MAITEANVKKWVQNLDEAILRADFYKRLNAASVDGDKILKEVQAPRFTLEGREKLFAPLPLHDEVFRSAALEWTFNELSTLSFLEWPTNIETSVNFAKAYVEYLRYFRQSVQNLHPLIALTDDEAWHKKDARLFTNYYMWEVLSRFQAQRLSKERLDAITQAIFPSDTHWVSDRGIDFLLAKALRIFTLTEVEEFLLKVKKEKVSCPSYEWFIYMDDFHDFKDVPLGWWREYRNWEF